MNITYAICVCNEASSLYSLISFIKKVKEQGDDINILVDTKHVTDSVRKVLKHYETDITVCERPFDGNFGEHRNYHITQCKGDYIFMLDPDEMPKELLIKNVKTMIKESGADFIAIPRININLGATKEWLDDHDYKTNEFDWINFPDYQGRLFKNSPNKINFKNELHEQISGYENGVHLQADPRLALWHIKTVDKDENRWSNGKYVSPKNEHIYDTLM